MLKLKLQYFGQSCEELTHWKTLWCWEGLGARGEGDDRGWDGWMASLTRWTWVWMNSGSWWWTGRPGMLRFMGSQRVGHDWATDLIWYKLTREGERDRWKEEREKERDTENECVFGRQVPGMRCEFVRSPTGSSCTHRVWTPHSAGCGSL